MSQTPLAVTATSKPAELTPAQAHNKIAAHLRSIRSMLQFFTVLLVLALLVQGCTVLLTL